MPSDGVLSADYRNAYRTALSIGLPENAVGWSSLRRPLKRPVTALIEKPSIITVSTEQRKPASNGNKLPASRHYTSNNSSKIMRQYSDLFFTTATILHWNPLLSENKYKDIIIDAFRFCVDQKRADIWALVIMNNHIHLVWHILDPYELQNVRQGLLKYTSQKIIAKLIDDGEIQKLEEFRVRRGDRNYQIWKRDTLSVEILYDKVLQQKINYIHNNLMKKGFNDLEYKYSSASYYENGIRNWDFLR